MIAKPTPSDERVMSPQCCSPDDRGDGPDARNARYRRVLWVIGATLWHAINGTLPHAATMGAVGVVALVANATVFILLWSYRAGDSNMRSVWLCSRNDVLGNVAVLLAALGVFGTGTGWPDIAVAAVMGLLALQGAWVVIHQAHTEIRQERFAIAVEWRGTGLRTSGSREDMLRCRPSPPAEPE